MNKLITKLKESNLDRKIFISLIVLGIVSRLVVMPFFGHEDIFLTYQRSFNISFNNVGLFAYNQHISHWIQSVNLIFYDLFFDKNNLSPFINKNGENPYLHFNLFWFKVPYLIFDILSLFVLSKILTGKRYKYHALLFYFLNPILIFSVYIFGRYEVFPIFFLLLSILFAKNNKNLLSIVFILIATLSRTSFAFFFFPILFGLNIKKKYKISLAILGPLVFISFFLAQYLLTGNTTNLKWISSGQHIGYFFDFKFQVYDNLFIYPFFLGYFLFLYNALFNDTRESFIRIKENLLITVALIFSCILFHPQYLAWAVPVLAITLPDNINYTKHLILSSIIIIVAFPIYMLFFGQGILMDIFSPISVELGNKNLLEFISRYYDGLQLASLAKTFISGSFIVIISSYIYQTRILNKRKNSDRM